MSDFKSTILQTKMDVSLWRLDESPNNRKGFRKKYLRPKTADRTRIVMLQG